MHLWGAGEGFIEEKDMTRKKIEPAVQVASAVQNTVTILAARVAALGGNLTEALARLGMGERRYSAELDQIANVFASVSAKDTPEIVAPEGGRVHIVHVPVDESVDWNAAISMGFPNTPASSDVLKVGDQYPPKRGAKPVTRETILVNFGRGISDTNIVLAWAKDHKLIPASPRSVWVLGEHKLQLHVELGQDVLVVVSLEECTFSGNRRVLYSWWDGGERKASLRWPGGWFNVHCWFAFVRES
ncbi:MAG: hypothetical protein WC790_01640 [Candidatus Paceibacterota bacterium]